MDKEASTSGVRVYFTIPFVTPSLGGIMIFLFPDSKSKANADKSISLQKFVPTQNPNPLESHMDSISYKIRLKKFHIVYFCNTNFMFCNLIRTQIFTFSVYVF